MISNSLTQTRAPWLMGVRDALPLLGGYIPVAISFGLIAIQSGFSPFEAVMISTLIYAGSSQFLFIGMIAADAPFALIVVMTLLINARHVVYGPNLAPWLTKSRTWPYLMHGLTDQIFALALVRLPELQAQQRVGWYAGAAILAWLSWIGGTALGAIAGAELMSHWPLLGEVLPFAMPALFLVLLAPKFNFLQWRIALVSATAVSLFLALNGFNNAAIPIAAACGCLCFYLADPRNFNKVRK